MPFRIRALDSLAVVGATALVVAWLVRLTIRDRYPIASTLFYATPWPALAALAAALSIFWFYRRWTRAASAAALVGLAGIAGALTTMQYHNETGPAASDVRIVLWNVAHPTWQLPRILRRLRAREADIIGIDEVGDRPGAHRIWRTAFPEYRSALGRGGMLLLTRGEILETETASLGARRGSYLLASIRLREVDYRVLLVDFASRPFASRQPAFERLRELIDEHAGENLIVLGDFNTPLDSVHFDPLRKKLTHAFESAGRGYGATWPVPIPVMALDHVWLGKSMAVTGCTLHGSLLSDHRLVEVTCRGRNGTAIPGRSSAASAPPGRRPAGRRWALPPVSASNSGSTRSRGLSPDGS